LPNNLRIPVVCCVVMVQVEQREFGGLGKQECGLDVGRSKPSEKANSTSQRSENALASMNTPIHRFTNQYSSAKVVLECDAVR
jgi:hypothetical protein